ncbi:glycosyltransferase family 39 protein [Colwellia sp. 1_MG-2023]|uniref:ArnT family glycosyltransferase n=1 Tax=Colwellia sp. 1_MG-2023 TaxID=3062649 RepID=UPI0026E1E3D5|nr:glycosyltransferase family 39 protein [Colwellia sp. 1_MG-2023]MDO6444992.1 glycosyltransferase family 39 protein [Colwellia sp. 1_MG-2023]
MNKDLKNKTYTSLVSYFKARPLECLVFLISSILSFYLVAQLNLEDNLIIGNADQGNMANLARNIAEGNGAVVDNVWLMTDGGLPGNSVTHAEPYWSVYVAAIIAPFFKVFGVSRFVFILPALLINIAIAGLVAWIVAKSAPTNRIPVILGFVISIFSIPMLNAINGFSDIYLTLFMLLTGLALVYAISMNKWLLFFIAGVFAGIAVAIKPSGLLLLGIWPVYLVFINDRIAILRNLVIFLFGMMVGLTPYFTYNKANFDTFLSPGLHLVSKALTIRDSIRKAEKDNNVERIGENKWDHAHRTALYDPDAIPVHSASSDTLVSKLSKYVIRLKTFIQKSFIWGMLIPLWLMPFVLLGIVEAVLKLKSKESITNRPFDLFLVFCVLMLISGFVLGSYVSFEVRYWNYMVPLSIVLAVVGTTKVPKLVTISLLIFSLYSGGDYLINHAGLKKSTPAYAKAIDILPEGAKVFTSSPWQFVFHTKIPSVILPYSEVPETIKNTAIRYGVEYIAIVDNDTKHAYYKPLEKGQTFDYLDLIYRDEHLILYKFIN